MVRSVLTVAFHYRIEVKLWHFWPVVNLNSIHSHHSRVGAAFKSGWCTSLVFQTEKNGENEKESTGGGMSYKKQLGASIYVL